MQNYCGLDVHKGSVFMCIINESGVVNQGKHMKSLLQVQQYQNSLSPRMGYYFNNRMQAQRNLRTAAPHTTYDPATG